MLKYVVTFVVIAASAGCLRNTSFKCEDTSDCTGAGAQAACEADGRCSFFDGSCTSMRRYADNSGSLSGQCVGGNPGEDANMGNEMPGNEMPPPMGCPADFVQMGPRNHGYKVLPNMGMWVAQKDACAAFGTFLAYPDGATLADAQAELAIIKTLGEDGAWVGITDQLVEGRYTRTFDNQQISAITNMLLNIGGNQGEKNSQDCLIVANTTIDDADCGDLRKAVCECVP